MPSSATPASKPSHPKTPRILLHLHRRRHGISQDLETGYKADARSERPRWSPRNRAVKGDGVKENERNTAVPVAVKRKEEAIRRERNAKEDAIKYTGSSGKIKKGAVNVREFFAERLGDACV